MAVVPKLFLAQPKSEVNEHFTTQAWNIEFYVLRQRKCFQLLYYCIFELS